MIINLDYSLAAYSDLIGVIRDNYKSYTVSRYCQAKKEGCLAEKSLIMRHDVDGNMKNALRMALLEADAGISSTYYFRMTPRLFQPEMIRRVSKLGHEVGYHYEVLSDAKGDYDKARRLFVRHLQTLRKIAPIKTVCMHGRPFSKHNNLGFWNKYKLDDFGLLAEPYLSIDYATMFYFTDTGLCWDNDKFNLRDHVNTRNKVRIESTSELIRFLSLERPMSVAILTHTNNWVDNEFLWVTNRSLYFIINRVKYMMKLFLTKHK